MIRPAAASRRGNRGPRRSPKPSELIAERHAKDQVVTAEQAEQLSRALPPGVARGRKAKGAAAAPEPTKTPEPAAQAQPSAEDGAAATPETYRDVIGPDGIKRRMRVVAPAL